jgi:hypothetical protein
MIAHTSTWTRSWIAWRMVADDDAFGSARSLTSTARFAEWKRSVGRGSATASGAILAQIDCPGVGSVTGRKLLVVGAR